MSPKKIHDSLNVAGAHAFVIRMSDDRAYHVPHTDYIVLTDDGEQAAFFEGGKRIRLIATEHITAIELAEKAEKRKN